jgi:hypothetical protein
MENTDHKSLEKQLEEEVRLKKEAFLKELYNRIESLNFNTKH